MRFRQGNNLATFLYMTIRMMMNPSKTKVFLSGLSPWIILGAVLVLLPVVAMMTLTNINRQKQQGIRLMMEKAPPRVIGRDVEVFFT